MDRVDENADDYCATEPTSARSNLPSPYAKNVPLLEVRVIFNDWGKFVNLEKGFGLVMIIFIRQPPGFAGGLPEFDGSGIIENCQWFMPRIPLGG